MRFSGVFKIIDWKESIEMQYDDGSKISRALVCQEYQGDIAGKSELQYQMYYDNSGDASFVGFEVLKAKINSEQNQIVMKHEGTFKNGIAASQFVIVNSGPSNELIEIKGYFESIEGGQAKYCIG